MSCRPMNEKFILLPHSMKTAQCLNFKLIGAFPLIWDRHNWLWNWNLSWNLVTKHTVLERYKKEHKEELEEVSKPGNAGRGRGRGGSSSFCYSCEQRFAFNSFQCWGVHQQSANLQFKWTLCTQVLHFQQLEGSHVWIQGCFALWRL